ncbi:transposase [Candidatus Uhrbacteria bacterium]|nr:transposase [Candidatus Uhrbacteria bacterium]
MARPLRIEYPGALYHVISRGNSRLPIFLGSRDRKDFLRVLADTVSSYKWSCHAYCLLDNHYHLLVETGEANLARGMKQLNGVYSQHFNKAHGRNGHVFEGRYKAFVIEKEPYLLEVARYIVLNPVRARVVKYPQQWRWSSYGATSGLVSIPPCLSVNWLLSQFSTKRRQAQILYKKFISDGMFLDDAGLTDGPLGYLQFKHALRESIHDVDDLIEIPVEERMIGRPSLKEIFYRIGDKTDRNKGIVLAYFRARYTQTDIAKYLDLHYSTVSKIIELAKIQNSRPDPVYGKARK